MWVLNELKFINHLDECVAQSRKWVLAVAVFITIASIAIIITIIVIQWAAVENDYFLLGSGRDTGGTWKNWEY